MKLLRSLTLVFLSVFLFNTTGAKEIWKGFEHLFTPPRNHVVYRVIDKIEINGKDNEEAWRHAEWSEYFVDIEGDKQPTPTCKTRMKMLWDDTNLYIFAELEEPHIWAYYNKNDMIVFHENDFEVFIDPNRDTHNYFEFEVNAINTLFDLFLNKPYRNGGKAYIDWDAKGFVSAVHIDGTLNNPQDVDNKWTVEMAIPFASLTTDGNFVQPKGDDVWKINFSRVNWQTEIVDGKYVRRKDPETGKLIPEYNWVWSEQGVINMHYPERWGLLQFSGNSVNGKKEIFTMPAEEEFARYLRLIYYKQVAYRNENNIYASSLESLNIPESGTDNGVSYLVELKTGDNTYTATLKTSEGLEISIDNESLFRVLSK